MCYLLAVRRGKIAQSRHWDFSKPGEAQKAEPRSADWCQLQDICSLSVILPAGRNR